MPIKYKIVEEEVEVLRITVLEGRGISVGTLSDAVDTPDPYVKLKVKGCPNAIQRTKAIPNKINPKWNEELKFFLVPETEKILEMKVMDEDFGFDDNVGTDEWQKYDIKQLKVGKPVYHTFQFGEKTSVDVKMVLEIDTSKQLRYGQDLCDEEKRFLDQRKKIVLQGMKKLLSDEKGPKNINEVPVVAVMGSGGGFRAMCGLSGVFCALEQMGIIDCATYVAGLSGSSWYISTLYSHEDWPSVSCTKVAKDIKDRIDTSFVRLLTPGHLSTYFEYINKKKSLGYPVSFTDFFGCLVGDTLLPNRKFKLSHARKKVSGAQCPLPLCTALHVEKDISAQLFSEWVEFSPFEVGLPKYGVFLKTELFGGKFYKGRLVRKHDEQFLHFLQGIWGSAFTILFQRLVKPEESANDDGRADMAKFCSSDGIKHRNEDSDSDDEVETDDEDGDKNDVEKTGEKEGLLSRIGHTLAYPFVWMYRAIAGKPEENTRKPKNHKKKESDEPTWKEWLNEIINSSSTLSSREGRAAEVHNIFRGLKVESLDPHDHERMVSNTVKNTFLVDGGLDFNSPYPLLLRPERNVNLILSFDFSQRDSDKTLPFAELLLAEEWAREHGYPFPPVAGDPRLEDNDIKELYIFEDKKDVKCPIVLHFVLINKTFKDYKLPGVPRQTEEEKSFGNFPVFDDEDQPYSSFKFDYTHEAFQRMFELMKFNTLLHEDVIKEKIADLVKIRRNNPSN